MALVKKLQPGGSLGSLDDELNKELGTYNLKSKDERKVRDALVKFRDYFATPEGKSFTADSLAKKYTISGQGSEQFTGSPDEVHSNWLTGKLKIDNDEDAMSVAAAIYGSASKNIQGTTGAGTGTTAGTSAGKTKIGLGDFNNYMVEDVYGTAKNLAGDFGKLSKDEDRQKVIMSHANQFVTDYLTNAEAHKDQFDYHDIDKVKNLQTAIATGKWDTFKTATYPFKWEVDDFMVQPGEKERFDADAAAKKVETEAAQATATSKKMVAEGMPKSLAELVSKSGFTGTYKQPLTLGGQNVTEQFSDYLKSKGYYLISDGIGRKKIVDASGVDVNSEGMEFDQFNPLNGVAWSHDAKGNLKFVASKYKQKDEGDIGKGLKTNIPGYEGWDVTGWSRQSVDEPITTRDYSKYLILKKDGKTIKIARDAAGQYALPGGATFGKESLLGYAGTNTIIQNWETPTEFASIEASQEFEPARAEAAIEGVTKMLEGKGEINDAAKSSIKAVISTLKYQSENATNNADKTRALKRLSGLNELLKREQIQLKLGGIIKRQQGGGLEKYAKPTIKDPNAVMSTTPTKSRDISGLVRGTSDLDKTILATNAAMLAPGWWGVGAGLIGTALEGYRDATDEEGFTLKDAGNMGLNLGLTAASFFGMGFLKGAKTGAKAGLEAAKLLDAGADIGKVATGVKSMTKGVKGGQEILNATNRITDFAKLNPTAKTIGELSKIAEIKKNTKIIEDLGKVATFSEKVAKSKTLLTLPTLGITGIAKGAKTIGTGLVLTNAAMNIGNLSSAAGKIWDGNIRDLSVDEVGAITSFAYAGKIAGTFGKMKIAKKYGMTSSTNSPAQLEISIKGRKTTISDPDVVNKFKKLKIPLMERNSEAKKLFVEKHNASVDTEIAKLDATKDALKIKTLNDSKVSLEDLKSTKIHMSKASESGFKVKKGVDLESGQNYYLQQLGMRWANRYSMAPSSKRVAESNWGKFKETAFGTPKTPEYRPAAVFTAEQVKQMKALKEAPMVLKRDAMGNPIKVHASLKAKDLGKDVKDWSRMIGEQTPTKNKISQQALSSRKKELKSYIDKYREVLGKKPMSVKKEGGIMKYKEPAGVLALGTLDPKTGMSIIAKNKSRLNHNPINKTTGIFDEKGQYTPDFIARRKAITPEWFAANKDEINKRITESGSTYKLETIGQLIAGASDFKPGILHDIVMNSARARVPDMAPMASKPMALSVKNPITLKPIIPKSGGDITIPERDSTWDKIKGYINPTSVANAAMYVNTVNTNRQVGDLQRQAVANSLYQLPYMPHSYMRVDRPNALLAEKQAAQVRSQGKRIAASSSDIDKANAVQLQGESQAQELVGKGQMADLARFDKLRSFQLENDSAIDQHNTQVLGKNRGMTAEAMQKIPLITANQRLSNASAFNNMMVAGERNYGVNQYKQGMNEYWKMSNDPKVRAAGETYSLEAGPEGEKRAKAEFEKEKELYKGTDREHIAFEDSDAAKNWEVRKTGLEKSLNAILEPVRQKQSWLQFYQPMMYMKTGGKTLSKEEKIDIENAKFNNTKRLKDTEWAYKAIMHNNEMLQKALIKVFK